MNSQKKQQPKKGEKHHFVPQGYLRGFTVDGKLYVLNKEWNDIRQSSPKGINYIEDFYIVDMIDKRNSREVEGGLQKIESTDIPIIRKLIKGDALNNSERTDLAIYIAVQYGRTPLAREKNDKAATIVATNELKLRLIEDCNDDRKYEEFTKGFQKKHPGMQLSRDKIKEVLLDLEKGATQVSVALSKGHHVIFMLENAEEIAQELLKYRWRVLRPSRNSSFITSDNPIAIEPTKPLLPYQKLAILLPAAKRYFALDSKHCLLIDNAPFERDITHKTVPKSRARYINKLLHKQARKYVISGSERLLDGLK